MFFSLTTKAENISITLVDSLGNPVSGAIISTAGKPLTSAVPLPVAIMDQIDKQFSPRVLTISAGQSVKFPNSDNIRHHVYSFSKPKTFEIKLYSGTPSDPVQFSEPGIVVLGCNIHDQMVGYIYVGQANESTFEIIHRTDQNGVATLEVEKDTKISIWHEKLPDISNPVSLSLEEVMLSHYKIKLDIKLNQEEKAASGFKRKFG